MAENSLFGGADISPLTNATAEDRRRADEFYRQLAYLQQQYQQQLAAQSATARALDRTISGTGLSVAGTQLQQGLNQTGAAVNAQASGASGQNAGVASYGAIQALAAAQAKAQQDAALLRAKEVEEAIKTKAGILNQQQQATGHMAGIDASSGTDLSGQATTAAGGVVKANEEETAAERAFVANMLNGLGSSMITYGTGAGKR